MEQIDQQTNKEVNLVENKEVNLVGDKEKNLVENSVVMQSQKKSFSINFISMIQFVLLCAESFLNNTIFAAKCLSSIFISLLAGNLPSKLSELNYYQKVNDEMSKQKNPLLFNVGVLLCSCFCLHLVSVMVSILFLPVLIICSTWAVLFGGVFVIKTYLPSVLKKIKQ